MGTYFDFTFKKITAQSENVVNIQRIDRLLREVDLTKNESMLQLSALKTISMQSQKGIVFLSKNIQHTST